MLGLTLAHISRFLFPIALLLGPTTQASLVWAQNLDFTPPKPVGPAKVQSSLWELAGSDPAAKPVGPPGSYGIAEPVVVILVPYPGEGSASIDTTSLASLGTRVLATSRSLIRVSVPPSSLVAVSELPGVGFVRRPHRPHPQLTLTEGGALINAWENYLVGVRGQGVKVAIIDPGFQGADELLGDMPATWRYLDFTDEGMYAGDSAHGTACAEIVHDVAPEAELWLYKAQDLVDLENAKDRCVVNGVDIISNSGSLPGTGFGDGLGLACDIVNDAAEEGILWVNSAGNYAKSHYSGFWNDSDADGWHNYTEDFELLNFEAEEGDEISLTLTWNDWPTTSENYDLYLYRYPTDQTKDVERVAESTDVQGILGGIPVERIEYDAETTGIHGIAVRNLGARPLMLRVWLGDHDLLEHARYSVPANSIGIPADARGAVSVGAIHHWDWESGQVADYSSRGPTTDGRIKPDLVAPSGVSVASYAPGLFGGTFAAAPHVAGAAALIKSANPSYSREDLWNALIAAAVDIDAFGRDNNTGYGKLVLPVMEVQEAAPPRITSLSPTSARYGQTVTINGSGFGASRGSGRVVFYGGAEPSSSQYLSWSDTRIRAWIPTGARTGDLRVITATGSDTAKLTITSPWVRSISPRSARTNTLVTVTGSNFGTARGSGSVRIGSLTISSYTSWSNSTIRFRIPENTRSGNLTVRTSEGTSNSVSLEITSPYLSRVSPTRVKPGARLTLLGGNFGSLRGSSHVPRIF